MTTKTDEQELLPCPFCGEAAYFERPGTNRQSCIVACESCGCGMETGETGHDCGGMWNERAALQSQDREDAGRLDWLDASNKKLRMGWSVGIAPAGNVSITSVVTLRRDPTPIREAIDHARRIEREGNVKNN